MPEFSQASTNSEGSTPNKPGVQASIGLKLLWDKLSILSLPQTHHHHRPYLL